MSKLFVYNRVHKAKLDKALTIFQQHVIKRYNFIKDYNAIYNFSKRKTRTNIKKLEKINSAINTILNTNEKFY